jgi:hypothetical protein
MHGDENRRKQNTRKIELSQPAKQIADTQAKIIIIYNYKTKMVTMAR